MKRLAWMTAVAVLLGGGCTCLNVETFQPYACNADGGANQCPGDGVCGLEGVCHARGDEQPWQCRDDSHCEGDWRCGLEGVCHQRGDEQAWLCNEDLQCEGAWRCGPLGRCLDPAREALVPASATGLAAVQLESPLPAGLPSHVSGSYEEVQFFVPGCEEAGLISFTDGGYSYTQRGARITSEVIGGALYKALRWAPSRQVLADGGNPSSAECAAYFADAGVALAERRLDVLQLPVEDVLSIVDVRETTYQLRSGGVLCKLQPSLTVGAPSTSVCAPVFSGNPAPTRLRMVGQASTAEPVIVGVGADHLQLFLPDRDVVEPVRQVRSAVTGSVLPINDAIAFGYTDLVMVAATPRGLYARRVDGKRIEDPAVSLAEDAWQPVLFPDVPCDPAREAGEGPPSDPRDLAFIFTSRSSLALAALAHVPFGPAERPFVERLPALVLVPAAPLADARGCVLLPGPGNSAGSPQVFGGLFRATACQVCPVNSAARWYWAGVESPFASGSPEQDGHLKVEARCENPDGGADIVALDVTGSCQPFDPAKNVAPEGPLVGARYARPVVADRSSVSSMTVVDDLGHIWQPVFAWDLEPWMLDRAPAFLVDEGGPLQAVRAEETRGRVGNRPVTVLPQRQFEETAEGYPAANQALFGRPIAPIAGEPRWLFAHTTGASLSDPLDVVLEHLPPGTRPNLSTRALAQLPPESNFGAPYHGAAARTPDGKRLLLLTSFDTLLAVEVSAVADAAAPTTELQYAELFASPAASVKFTAVAHTPVQSLAVLAPAPGGPFAHGYLVQSSRLFEFRASNLNVWRTEEIVLEDVTEPLAVFADGVRGRVGMLNGTVYSLPSRLTLADALPQSAQPATQFLQHCGHLFVSAADGVYRLAVGSDPKGSWERLALPPTLGYAGAHLYGHGEALRVFTSDGVPFEVEGFECRAPAQ